MSNFSYTIKSEYKLVTELVNKFRGDIVEKNIPERICNELELCLVEALNNVVRHAYKENPGNNISMGVQVTENEIEIKIIDYGLPRPADTKSRLDFDPKDIQNLPEGGMGLYIIDQLMDSAVYTSNDGQNIFTLKKLINR